MSAPLSVVIPTLDAVSVIGPTLASVAEELQTGLVKELVISDGGSADGVAELADEIGANFVAGSAGRGGQLRRGGAAARGPWLLFLHADSILPSGWGAAAAAHMQAEPGKAAVFQLRYDQRGVGPSVVAGWANLRTRLFALPYGDQGLLIHRALYDAVGGHPDQPLMEDVELARRLGPRRLVVLSPAIETSFVRYAKDGWIRRGVRNLTTLALYRCGVPSERLVERYHK